MKQCTKCKESKSLEEFHNHAGRPEGKADWCKPCARAYKSRPETLARQRERRQLPENKVKQQQYWQTDAYKESQRNYRQSKKGKAGSKKYHARRRRLYPERIKAKDAVHNAIRDGRLTPVGELPCCGCGKQAEHYHHESYEPEHRLDVIPFCESCHKFLHHSTQE